MDDDIAGSIEEWLEVIDELTHYEVLGIEKRADAAEVQHAFHQFSASFHPDRHRSRPDDLRAGAARIFKRGVEAYRVLKSRTLRADYDLMLAKRSVPPDARRRRSLDELCRTKAGRLHARQAERAIVEGQPRQALLLLEKSLAAEGTNPELADRYEALQQIVMLSEPPGPAED